MRPTHPDRQTDDTFASLWRDLFSTKSHLDSLLARLHPKKKSIYAQILPRILAQPVSLARELGVGVKSGEPWNLSLEALREWPVATQISERLIAQLDKGIPQVPAVAEDYPPSWKVAPNLVQPLAAAAPLSLRISRSISPDEALKLLKKEKDIGVKAGPSTISPVGLRIEGYTPVLHSKLHEEGKLEIQDEGSQLMALFALNPALVAPLLTELPGKIPEGKRPILEKFPAWTVIDSCAGAGGKSLALADYLENRGRIFAYDISERKIMALRQRSRRAQWNNLKAVVVDAENTTSLEAHHKTADRVLVDAPCSGWGVLRRNPDTKWKENFEQLNRLPEYQLSILNRYSDLVKVGGILTYGVCTFRPEETTAVVAAFSSGRSDFRPIASGYLGPDLTDGFYMAAWERISE